MLKLKDEGNKLFGRQDYSKALEAYEKALKHASPEAKEEIAQLHSNKAACYIMIKRYGGDCILLLVSARSVCSM